MDGEDPDYAPEGYPLKCKLAVGAGIFALIAIPLFVACMVGSIHTIQEGSVGIYYVQGRDLPD